LYHVTCDAGRGGIPGKERCEKLNGDGYIKVPKIVMLCYVR